MRLQWRPGPREGTFDGVVMSVDTNLSKKQQADGVKLRFEVHYDDHDRRIHAFPCAVDKKKVRGYAGQLPTIPTNKKHKYTSTMLRYRGSDLY